MFYAGHDHQNIGKIKDSEDARIKHQIKKKAQVYLVIKKLHRAGFIPDLYKNTEVTIYKDWVLDFNGRLRIKVNDDIMRYYLKPIPLKESKLWGSKYKYESSY